MKRILFVLCTLSSTLLLAQAPEIEWQKTFGGSGSEYAKCIRQTTDGGYIVVGTTPSNNGNVSGNHGGDDAWLIKLNASGDLQWQKCLGGSSTENGNAVRQTTDGGYIIAGDAASNNGNVSGGNGSNDFWVVKVNASGELEWQNTFGGSSYDHAYDIEQTSDGGYIAVGSVNSTNGDVTNYNGGMFDGWVVKLSATGELQWQKTFGGSGADQLRSVKQTTDGGYIMAGTTDSNNGIVNDNNGGVDFWVVKIDTSGNLQWQNALGGSNNDNGQAVIQASDGTYMAIGSTSSFGGDVSGNHGGMDVWMVKLSTSGELLWQKCFGGTGSEVGRSIAQTSDSGFIVSGFSTSSNHDVTFNNGGFDFWIFKTDNSGNLQWQKSLGGSGTDDSTSVQQTADGGYVLTGSTTSTNGNVTHNNGIYDFWIVKLEATEMSVSEYLSSSVKIYPNPASEHINIETELADIHVTIFDIQGKALFKSDINSRLFTINTESFANGIYLIQMHHGNSILNKKLIIAH